MGWLDSIGGGLSSLFGSGGLSSLFGSGGLSSLFGSAGKALSSGAGYLGQGIQSGANLIGQGAQGVGNLIGQGASKIGSGISGLFGGGSSGAKNAYNGFTNTPIGSQAGSGFNVGGMSAKGIPMSYGSISSNAPGNGSGMLSQLFNNKYVNNDVTKGLMGLGASQMIGNPKVPALPSSYNDLMNQINAGGNSGTQAASKYYEGVLSGNDQNAYNAATRSIDQNYEEQVRQLNSMYKSLRPGTDPTSDSTYQRDLQNLNNNYQQQRAMALAGVQQGAASGAAGMGNAQLQNQMSMLQAPIQQQAQQWMADYQKQAELRNALMGIAGGYAKKSNSSPFAQLFGG